MSVSIVFGVDDQCRKQIYILDIQPATRSDEKISSTVFKWQNCIKNSLLVQPGEVSIEIAFRVIKDKSNPSRIDPMRFERGSKVGLRITAQSIGAIREGFDLSFMTRK